MGQEQRRFERVPAAFRVQCRLQGDLTGGWHSVVTGDISAGGLSFQSDQLYEPSESLEIQIELPSFRVPLILSGRIVRSRALPGGVCECAVEFANLEPEQQAAIDELVGFLRKFKPSSP